MSTGIRDVIDLAVIASQRMTIRRVLSGEYASMMHTDMPRVSTAVEIWTLGDGRILDSLIIRW
jgi:hypothetical protein